VGNHVTAFKSFHRKFSRLFISTRILRLRWDLWKALRLSSWVLRGFHFHPLRHHRRQPRLLIRPRDSTGMDNNMGRTGDAEVIEVVEEDKDKGTEVVEDITRREDGHDFLIPATTIRPTMPIQLHPFLHHHTCLPRHMPGKRKAIKLLKTNPRTLHNFRRHRGPTSNYLTTRRTCLSPIPRLLHI
jgi:hypothetical protein